MKPAPRNANALGKQGAGQNQSGDNTNNSTDFFESIKEKLATRVWLASYNLEELRERYADRRQLLRQAATCIALALLRLAGVR